LPDEAAFRASVRLEELEQWRKGLRTVSGVAGWASGEFTVEGLGAPRVLRAALLTEDFFDLLGARPATGRFPRRGEPGSAVVAANLGPAIGQSITIGAVALPVTGTLSTAFPIPDRADLWLPASSIEPLQIGRTSNLRSFQLVARLAPGVSLDQAQDDARRVMREIEIARGGAGVMRVSVDPLSEVLAGQTRPVLLAFTAAAALLLLVACANVAVLLMGRGAARMRERTVRLALGATSARLVRTALLESLLIAAAGAVLGAAIAAYALSILPALVEGALPRRSFDAIGAPAVLTAALIAIVATLLSGLVPAWSAARADAALILRSQNVAGSRAGRRASGALVVVQIAMSVVLLIGAGLLGRTVVRLLTTDLGMDGHGTVTFQLRMNEISRFDAATRAPFLLELLRQVRAVPGVEAAGIGTNLPPITAPVAFTIRVVQDGRSETRTFDLASASPGYFEAVRARLVRGRWFETSDETVAPVAVLSEAAMRHLAPVGDPVGRPTPFGLATPTGARVTPTVIGVIEDIRHRGVDQPASGSIYLLWSALPASTVQLAVRSARGRDDIAPVILQILRELDPSMPLPEARTVDDQVRLSIAGREMRATLVGAFAILAGVLALSGLSTALARSVHERRREIAIRAALGATPERATLYVLRDGLALAGIGLALGFGIAAALGKASATLLYAVSPYDLTTYATVATVVGLLALFAAWLPARRASHIQPLELLRSE
jgi:predicted permease